LLYHGGNSNRDAIIRHIGDYDGVGANYDVVTDFYWTENFRARANVDVVADHRCNWLVDAPQTHYDAGPDAAVVSKAGKPAYHNGSKMVDYEITTDLDLTWQLHSRNYLNEFMQDSINE
jgi:hypothetical protein